MKKLLSRSLVVIMAIAILLTSVACRGNSSSTTGSQSTQPQASSAAKPDYSNVTLRVILCNHPWTESMKGFWADFEKQTGMKLNIENYAEVQLTQKITVEMSAGNSTMDVIMNRPLQEGLVYLKNKWYEPLNSYISDTTKTSSDWDFKDFTTSSTNVVTDKSGTTFAISNAGDFETVYYRKDLFDKAGLKPPTTFAEFEADCAKFTDKSKNMYGIVMRGIRSAVATPFSGFLYGMGGDFLKNNMCTLDTPEAIQAFKFYGKMLHDYGPPGVTNMSWPESTSLFASGKAAMCIDASSTCAGIIDPKKSAVADKVGFASMPGGKAGSVPFDLATWALSITATSKNKDASWQLIQWATNKEMAKKVQLMGVTVKRTSVLTDPDVLTKLPTGYGDVALAAGKTGKPYSSPMITSSQEARDEIGNVLTKSIETGGDASIDALAKACTQKINALMAKSGEGGK
jgi:multiple sugar transport system substrate-binding protein